MRVCANCGRSIDGYRRQAIYCGGPCRAAVSRERAAQGSSNTRTAPEPTAPVETAQNRTQRAAHELEWRIATGAEEVEAQRLWRKFPEMWEAA